MIQIKECPVCSSSHIRKEVEVASQLSNDGKIFRFDLCMDCRVVFLNPRPDPEELSQYYQSDYLPYQGAEAWGKYAKYVRNSEKKLDQRRVDLCKIIPGVSNGANIIDIGCGKPTFLNAIRDQLKLNCTGIDFSSDGWKSGEFSGINLIQGEINDLNPGSNAEILTMWHYLEHVYNPVEVLKKAREHCKPGGHIVIEVPNYLSESRAKYGQFWGGYHAPRHMTLFSPKNLSLALKKSGWTPVSIYSHGTLHPYILYWLSEIEKDKKVFGETLENEFIPFVKGLIRHWPTYRKQRQRSLGVMTAIARC